MFCSQRCMIVSLFTDKLNLQNFELVKYVHCILCYQTKVNIESNREFANEIVYSRQNTIYLSLLDDIF